MRTKNCAAMQGAEAGFEPEASTELEARSEPSVSTVPQGSDPALRAIRKDSKLLRSWLLATGQTEEEVQSLAYKRVSELIRQHFDGQRLDSLMEDQGEPFWLRAMLGERRWRDLLYELLEENPMCVLLQCAVSLASNVHVFPH